MDEYNISDLKALRVIDQSAHYIGTIVDWVLDTHEMRLTRMTVQVDKELQDYLGLKKGFFKSATLDIGTEHVKAIGDNILLGIDREELSNLIYDDEELA
jgi:sporulation protein YlmC with PRC-barrel domain